MDKAEVAFVATVILVIAVVLGLLLWWVDASRSAAQESCEERGGHQYSRTAGKITYYKCVTDDNHVLEM